MPYRRNPTKAPRRRRAPPRNLKRVFAKIRARRKGRGFRRPIPGGASLVLPIKVGFTDELLGNGTSYINLNGATHNADMTKAPADWFTRYEPIFDYIRINKIKYEILCPYSIGQHGVGTQSLYQLWTKKAQTSGELAPGSQTEWLNMQNAKRTIFSGRKNSITLWYTPGYETTVQPLNTAATSLRVLYKQWQTIQDAPTKMTPHIGILGTISRIDGSTMANTNVFKINCTMFCSLKGIKQL